MSNSGTEAQTLLRGSFRHIKFEIKRLIEQLREFSELPGTKTYLATPISSANRLYLR